MIYDLRDTKIICNPETCGQIQKLVDKSQYHELRGIFDKNNHDVYLWLSEKITHCDVYDGLKDYYDIHLKVPNTNTFYLFKKVLKKDNRIVYYLKASEGSSSVKRYLKKSEIMKKFFNKFETKTTKL